MYLLCIVEEVEMVGSAQNDHLFCRWRPFKQLVHPSEWKRNILLGDQIECGNVAIPVESQSYRKDSRLCLGASGWGEGHHRSDSPVSLSCRERGPTSEAVSHDSNPSGINLKFRAAGCRIEQMIEEKACVGHTVRDPSLCSGSLLLLGLIIPTRQIRADDLGMIQGRNNIPVAAQVRAEKRRTPPILPTRMREDDQRVGSRLGRRIAHRELASRFVEQRNSEDVLGFWRQILARMPGVRGVPEFIRKKSVARCIECFKGAHTGRKSTPYEWIVRVSHRTRLTHARWIRQLRVRATRLGRRNQHSGEATGALEVVLDNPSASGAGFALFRQHHDRAAESTSGQSRTQNPKLAAAKLDQQINLRRRDFEIISHRRVGSAQQGAKCIDITGLEGFDHRQDTLILGENVARAPIQRPGKPRHLDQVIRGEISKLIDSKQLSGPLAFRAPDSVIASRVLMREPGADHQRLYSVWKGYANVLERTSVDEQTLAALTETANHRIHHAHRGSDELGLNSLADQGKLDVTIRMPKGHAQGA